MLKFGLCVGLVLSLGAAEPAQAQTITKLVQGSAFKGVHGIKFAPSGELYAGSVVGQTLYGVNVDTGAVRVIEKPPEGMADDMAFGPGGQVVWTSISASLVRSRIGNGPVTVLAKDMPGANSIAFSRDGKRLFLGQVFQGDGVWELDPKGIKPPRAITGPVGGFNSFAPGPDGMLYGPLWFKNQVVRINPDTGAVTVVADGFKTPAAAKFNSRNVLYVIATESGELFAVDIKTGSKTRVAQFSSSLDNIAVSRDDRVFVSNMADNGIQEVNVETGALRQVVPGGGLAIPADIAVTSKDGHDTLYVADVFAYRSVDGTTGKVTDIARAHGPVHLDYPTGVSVSGNSVYLSGVATGTVQVFDQTTGKSTALMGDFKVPADAIMMPGGALMVAEIGSGNLVQVRGEVRTVLRSGLKGPAGLALAADGSILVAEIDAGRVTRVDPSTGASTALAEGLNRPKAIAVTTTGQVLVLEVGARRIIEIDPKTGTRKQVIDNLPVGFETQPGLTGAGIAVGETGVIYLASDVENSIYKIVR